MKKMIGSLLYLITKVIPKVYAEEWLPIVNEKGEVRGRVTLSQSNELGNKYLHPLIRVALVHNGMLFLVRKPSPFAGEPQSLDYPFESLLKYKESLDKGVERTLRLCEESALSYSYLFRYLYKSDKRNSLVFLYVSNVFDEEQAKQLRLGEGKWWMSKQIEENLNTGLFSDCFEKEYEFLKETIIMADKLMRSDLI